MPIKPPAKTGLCNEKEAGKKQDCFHDVLTCMVVCLWISEFVILYEQNNEILLSINEEPLMNQICETVKNIAYEEVDAVGSCNSSSISVTPPEMANFIASEELISVNTRTRSLFTKYKWPANAYDWGK